MRISGLVENQKLYLLALAMIKGLGPVHIRNLIAYCGSPRAVFDSPKARLLRVPGIGANNARLIRDIDALKRAEEELLFCEKHQIRAITYLEKDYPQNLKYLQKAPLFLFLRGNIDLNAQPSIAIVGTRRCTDYGRDMAMELSRFFAERGINVVSGLAYGIDISAHRAALKADGMTTAVLGHGLAHLYPSVHRARAQEMLKRGGLLTAFSSQVKAEATNFPARNSIISGISRAVVVVEAAESGGALITAQLAFEQNKEVYAVPGRLGDIYSKGCHHIIRDQVAKLLTDPQEILDDLEIQWQPHSEPASHTDDQLSFNFSEDLSTQEHKVLSFLGRGEALVDQITAHTAIPMYELNALLLNMEFKGLLKQLPGKKFRRI